VCDKFCIFIIFEAFAVWLEPTDRKFTTSKTGFSHINNNVAKAFLPSHLSIPLAEVQRQYNKNYQMDFVVNPKE
jgi:hypothetical protein